MADEYRFYSNYLEVLNDGILYGQLFTQLTYIQDTQNSDSNMLAGLEYLQNTELQQADPVERTTFTIVQDTEYQELDPIMRTQFVYTQVALKAPEDFMSGELFPQLKGLMFSTFQKPLFSTKVAEHTSSKETRTSYWDYPLYEFTISFDYLPNRSLGVTDLKTLEGFFLARKGRFDDFLFKASDDYQQEEILLFTGDGNQVEYPFVRQLGTYREPVGQVKADTVAIRINQTERIAPVGGTVTVRYPALNQVILVRRVSPSTPFTQVPSSPGTDEYSVNMTTGVFTFNAAYNGVQFDFHYDADVGNSDYTVLQPNRLVLDTAPTIGGLVYAAYEYYYICRFKDDEADFEQFMDRLWNLNEVVIRSVKL